VPLRQALAVFGETPSFLRERERDRERDRQER
jgi:hypothetical protein